MKNFTKFMLSAAAITAVSAAMAVSAMAAVGGSYDAATGKVTLTGVESSGDQQTLLVLTEDAATVTEGIIAQIDQDTAISEFVLPSGIESGTYYVRIGGTNGTIQTYTLTIGSGGGGGESGQVTVLVGDIDGDGDVTSSDSVIALRYEAWMEPDLTDLQVATGAYCAEEYDTLDSSDSVNILRYEAWMESGNAGEEMAITIE